MKAYTHTSTDHFIELSAEGLSLERIAVADVGKVALVTAVLLLGLHDPSALHQVCTVSRNPISVTYSQSATYENTPSLMVQMLQHQLGRLWQFPAASVRPRLRELYCSVRGLPCSTCPLRFLE